MIGSNARTVGVLVSYLLLLDGFRVTTLRFLDDEGPDNEDSVLIGLRSFSATEDSGIDLTCTVNFETNSLDISACIIGDRDRIRLVRQFYTAVQNTSVGPASKLTGEPNFKTVSTTLR